jgi:hypothetical protein
VQCSVVVLHCCAVQCSGVTLLCSAVQWCYTAVQCSAVVPTVERPTLAGQDLPVISGNYHLAAAALHCTALLLLQCSAVQRDPIQVGAGSRGSGLAAFGPTTASKRRRSKLHIQGSMLHAPTGRTLLTNRRDTINQHFSNDCFTCRVTTVHHQAGRGREECQECKTG